jgi:phage major head subunit gpT-like protein
MAVPHVSTNFGDLLAPDFEEIFDAEYRQLRSKREDLYGIVPSNGRDLMKWSGVGTLPDFNQFTGTIEYQSQHQGYDTTATYLEFASGCQVERKLFDDDQYNVMNQRPAALGASAARTREKHAARALNMAFSDDTMFYDTTENVALCSNSHTTTSGASTANGFDNLITAALTAVAVATARIQMVGFRGDQAERIDVTPDELWYPPDLYENAYEIISASGKLDTANNNPNVHEGKYTGHEWRYLTDSNNWFMMDSMVRARMLHWIDRIALEFGMIEDFDTLIAKFRAYMRYAYAWTDWRFILGAQVS